MWIVFIIVCYMTIHQINFIVRFRILHLRESFQLLYQLQGLHTLLFRQRHLVELCQVTFYDGLAVISLSATGRTLYLGIGQQLLHLLNGIFLQHLVETADACCGLTTSTAHLGLLTILQLKQYLTRHKVLGLRTSHLIYFVLIVIADLSTYRHTRKQ